MSKSPATTQTADISVTVLRCLGQVEALVEGAPVKLSPQQRLTLALLVAAGPPGLTAEQLTNQLYDEMPKSGEQAAVMQMARLRQRVTAITTGGRYRIDDAALPVDVWRFESLISTDPAAAVRLWDSPFGGVPNLPPMLLTKLQNLQQQYRAALETVGWQIASRRDSAELSRLLDAVQDSPRDEALAGCAGAALYRLGRQADGLALVRACQETLNDAGLVPGNALGQIEHAILTHDDTMLAPRSDLATRRTQIQAPELPPAFSQPPPLLIGREEPTEVIVRAVDRIKAMQQSRPGAGEILVVRGRSGAGKTAMLRAVIHDVKDSDLRVRVGTSEADATPYRSIRLALPETTAAIADLIEGGDPTTERTRVAAEVLRVIQTISDDGPLLIVIDDAHAATAQTLALLRSLVPNTLPGNVLLVIATQPAKEDSEWAEVLGFLTREGGAELIDLEPLTVDDVEEMVDRDHPEEAPIRRARFARRIYTLSEGNAHVASRLSQDAPPDLNTILLPEAINSEASLGAHLRRKLHDPQLEDLLTSAALIGLRFSQELLAHVVDLPVEAVAETLAEAARLEVCKYVGDGHWQFDHLLTVNYFTCRLPLLRPLVFARIALHELAPIESMVRYVSGAGDNLGADFAYHALVRSGRERAAAFAFDEAFVTLEKALELAPEGSDLLDVHIEFAACASRSSRLDVARTQRGAAFALAVERGDHDAMARAALAGLPSGEYAGGEPDRLEMLEHLDTTQVTSFSPEELACFWLRQARMSKELSSVQSLLDEAETRFALLPAEVASSAESIRLRHEQLVVRSNAIDATCVAGDLGALADQCELGPLRAAIRQSEAVAAVSEGQPDALTFVLPRARSEVHAYGAPRTRWLSDGFEASLAVAGVPLSGASIETARASGLRWAIPDMHTTWQVQVQIQTWLAGRYQEALAAMDASAGYVATNLAWEASEAMFAAKVDKPERAQVIVDDVCERLPRQLEGPWAPTAAAILAETAADLGDSAAAKLAYEVLRHRGGRVIVIGAGSGYLGPADRYLGLATATFSTVEDALPYFDRAIASGVGPTDAWAERAKADRHALLG